MKTTVSGSQSGRWDCGLVRIIDSFCLRDVPKSAAGKNFRSGMASLP